MICDFHIHWKYARWCSKRLDVEHIWKYSIIKWIDIVWTWDFTHPDWFEELKKYLKEDGRWFLIPKKEYLENWLEDIKPFLAQSLVDKLEKWFYPRFVFQTEINNVFARKKDLKGKFTIRISSEESKSVNKNIKKARIHNVILIDTFENAEKIFKYLSQFGKIDSDGRLSVRQDQADTLFWLKKNVPSVIFFPAHIWTPYFWVLGSKFWFSSLKEAFLDSYFLIDWIETGLSSDPIMNWINPELDPFVIVSNSDAHSLENLGREGNVIIKKSEENLKKSEEEFDFTYKDLEKIFKERKYTLFRERLLDFERQYLDSLFNWSVKLDFYLSETIEFYPQEWKYFGDWHSKCQVSFTPQETRERHWKCPICWKDITIWVFHRTFELGDKNREEEINFWSKYFWFLDEIEKIAKKFNRPKYRYFVPLRDIIYEVWWKKKGTKGAEKIYNDLIYKFWPEFYILLELPLEKVYEYDKKFWLALEKVRKWNIFIKSWYDGVYWIVKIFDYENNQENTKDKKRKYKQNSLF